MVCQLFTERVWCINKEICLTYVNTNTKYAICVGLAHTREGGLLFCEISLILKCEILNLCCKKQLVLSNTNFHLYAMQQICLHNSRSSKFPYEDIREVHKRRYLLQPIAVEVFSADGRNYLLALPPKCRNKVYAK